MSSWAGIVSPDIGGPGTLVGGKYRLGRPLAAGGMGVVIAATHEQLGVPVALKFLLEDWAKSPEARARFAREAHSAALIQNEHVVRVSDVGELDSGIPYLVMEYLEGRDLAEVIVARGPLPVVEAVGYALQAAEGIAEAHALGIVHRDIKPSNLFVSRLANDREVVKVLDFGISKIAEGWNGHDVHLTTTHGMMGSPTYMAPEQIRSARDVDVRVDVWSLALVLYELLAAESAFQAEAAPALFAKIVIEPPRPLDPKLGVPAALQRVLLACLEKERDRRVPSIADLARRLEPFADADGKRSVERILATSRAALRAGAGVKGRDSAPPGTAVEQGAFESPRRTAAAWAHTSPRTARARRSLLISAVAAVPLLALLVQHLLSRTVEAPVQRPSAGVVSQPSAPTPRQPPAIATARVDEQPAPTAREVQSAAARPGQPVASAPNKPKTLAANPVQKSSRVSAPREDVLFDGTQ